MPLRPPCRSRRIALLAFLATLAGAQGALAVMDITNNGPRLQAGRFEMRITNIGVIGNAFANTGLSFDPSFQYPRGGRLELLNHAELWVGATTADGTPRVSGGPMLEWRPTLDPRDTVRVANAGDVGTRSHADDDGDGRIDEDPLNGRDDDGDGRVDEDFLLPAQQMLTAEFTDDQRQAIEYTYPTSERHVPLGLAVHQEAYAFALPGHDDVAGFTYTITNRGTERLRDVRMGVYADLDVRASAGGPGHLDDHYVPVHYLVLLNPREDTLSHYAKPCADRIEGDAALIRDANPASGNAGVLIVPLTHTTDPVGWFLNDAFPGVREARASSRAPRRDSTFTLQPFLAGGPPGLGGPPTLDGDRYRALAGTFPTAHVEPGQDYAVLLSCGPFAHLDPGQSLRFSFALTAVAAPESAATAAFMTRMLFRGARLDLQANGRRRDPQVGDTGINGHESCVEPSPGVVFQYDPDCVDKLFFDPLVRDLDPHALPASGGRNTEYSNGHCVWTDLDCDMCTGDDGVDTVRPWESDVRLPPAPRTRATPGSHRVTLEWDDLPEQAIRAGRVGGGTFRFAGYKIYRLDDWRRESLLPEPRQWQRLGVYRVDPSEGGLPLTTLTDDRVTPLDFEPSGPRYPIGRYRFEDTRVLDGFDYHYVVTAILREIMGPYDLLPPREFESPFYASFEDRVVPHAAAAPAAGQAWVVPNPYRGSAPWDRPPIPGDVFTRHLDFMGLPRARCTVRIYTLAGDLVQTLEYDGSAGDGQTSWNLISRNGQDIESGVYLFTVSSALGHQVGRFVVLR